MFENRSKVKIIGGKCKISTNFEPSVSKLFEISDLQNFKISRNLS